DERAYRRRAPVRGERRGGGDAVPLRPGAAPRAQALDRLRAAPQGRAGGRRRGEAGGRREEEEAPALGDPRGEGGLLGRRRGQPLRSGGGGVREGAGRLLLRGDREDPGEEHLRDRGGARVSLA